VATWQTIVIERGVLPFMRDMPIGKIRFLGGKLGAAVVNRLAVEKVRTRLDVRACQRWALLLTWRPRALLQSASHPQAGDLWQFDEAELRRQCGDAYGTWLYNICRGVDHDPGARSRQHRRRVWCGRRGPLTLPWQASAWRPGWAAVEPKSQTKSMMAAKSFTPVHDARVIDKWIYTLARELTDRLQEEHDASGRWPKTLQVRVAPTIGRKRCERGPLNLD